MKNSENLMLIWKRNGILNLAEACACPECGGEYHRPYEVKFIKQYGVCAHCDKVLETY